MNLRFELATRIKRNTLSKLYDAYISGCHISANIKWISYLLLFTISDYADLLEMRNVRCQSKLNASFEN